MAIGPEIHARLSALRVLIAFHDEFERSMTAQDLIEAFPDIPGIDDLKITPAQHGKQIYSIGHHSVMIWPNTSLENIGCALSKMMGVTPVPKNTFSQAQPMSITGAPSLKARFEAAKARKAAIEAKADEAVKNYNNAGDLAEGAIRQLEEDAQALLAEVKDYSNG